MHSDLPDPPEPDVDPDPQRAPGGADADLSESDVGAASEGPPVTPDPPFSAQREEDEIPDELTTPEEPDDTEDDEGDDGETSEPTA